MGLEVSVYVKTSNLNYAPIFVNVLTEVTAEKIPESPENFAYLNRSLRIEGQIKKSIYQMKAYLLAVCWFIKKFDYLH